MLEGMLLLLKGWGVFVVMEEKVKAAAAAATSTVVLVVELSRFQSKKLRGNGRVGGGGGKLNAKRWGN